MQDSLQNIVEPLLQWYAVHKRELPWRRDREPYHVWVSEIMLQQTRIEAVRRYYERFMQALPDVASLSRIPEDDLLKLWEGLGYYSRARNLRKAAQIIMQDYNGIFPRSAQQLRKLPGIGEYTAGAVASICFDERVPAVDGNVLRVIARVTGSRENVLLPETKKAVSARLADIIPEQAGTFNEALMELGELVCSPDGTPDCTHCPLSAQCTAYRDDLTGELPVRIKSVRRRREDKTVFLLITDDGRIAIEKRIAPGLLSGMYQFPNTDGFCTDGQIAALMEQWQFVPSEIRFIRDAKHAFTHIDWYMKGYLVRGTNSGGHFLWVSPAELEQSYPLPTAFRIFL